MRARTIFAGGQAKLMKPKKNVTPLATAPALVSQGALPNIPLIWGERERKLFRFEGVKRLA